MRQWWIKEPIGTGGDVFNLESKKTRDELYKEDGYGEAPWEKYVHVVEYAEYEKLKEALEEIAVAPCPLDSSAMTLWIDFAKDMARKVLKGNSP